MLDKAEEAQNQVLLETCPSLAREERSSLAQTEMYRVGLIAAAVYSRAPGRTWLEMHACDAHTPLQHQRLTDFENVLAVIRRDVCYRQGAALLSFFSTACQHFAETWCIGSGPE